MIHLTVAALLLATTPAELVESTDAWHAERIERLTAPEGWLSLAGLEWLNEGANTVGSAEDADVSYTNFWPEHIGTITVDGDRITFEPAQGLNVPYAPADGVLLADTHEDGPTVLHSGDVRYYVIERGGRYAVRIKDPEAPTLTGFEGIDRFPVSAEWVVTAAFEPAAGTIGLDSVVGLPMESDIAGYARFERDGHEINAVLYKSGGENMYLRFADETNATGSTGSTYTVGRYLTVAPPDDSQSFASVTLDFNRSYNPPCALTDFATCTIPPESNTFPFPVTAGEKWDAGH